MKIIIEGDAKFVERLLKENRIRFSRKELSWHEETEEVPEACPELTTEADAGPTPEVKPENKGKKEQGEDKESADASAIVTGGELVSADLDSDPDF